MQLSVILVSYVQLYPKLNRYEFFNRSPLNVNANLFYSVLIWTRHKKFEFPCDCEE